jgi:hypothetical protein
VSGKLSEQSLTVFFRRGSEQQLLDSAADVALAERCPLLYADVRKELAQPEVARVVTKGWVNQVFSFKLRKQDCFGTEQAVGYVDLWHTKFRATYPDAAMWQRLSKDLNDACAKSLYEFGLFVVGSLAHRAPPLLAVKVFLGQDSVN